ncbi:MAG: 2-hydroxyacid dehydrogenase [Candidatus Heimdallarchaeota archaeon]
MTQFKVLLTRKIPQPAIDYMLEKGIDLEINAEDRVLTHAEIKERVKGKDGLICLLTDSIDGDIMEAAGPKLKIIANYAVGYNNIDVQEASKRKIPVTNTPGVLTETTADLAVALLLSIGRRIVESDKYTRDGKFKGWGPMLHLGNDIHGKTLGVIGCGRIGSAVARRLAKGFNMKVLYNNTKKLPDLENELGLEFASVEEILTKSDYVTLHVPLTEKTKHMIGEKELALMKPTAVLINTSRGSVIVESALVKALQEKRIAGAALDVYEFEPKLSSGLKELDNVIITAHIGTGTIDTRTKMGMMVGEDLLSGLNNKQPENCINPQIYD